MEQTKLAVSLTVKSFEIVETQGTQPDKVIINGLTIGEELSGRWITSFLVKTKVLEPTELTIYYGKPSLLLDEDMKNDLKKIQEAGELIESQKEQDAVQKWKNVVKKRSWFLNSERKYSY